METQRKLMTAAELFEYLGVSKSGGYKMASQGAFDAFMVRIGEKAIRFRPDGLERWLQNGSADTAPDSSGEVTPLVFGK